jgi:processive 1,2-diacylglycerol beta-glucosyltransferase
MKILIVYASAGTGHRRAAEAVFDSLDDPLKPDSRLVDLLDFSPPPFKFIYSFGYTFLITQLPLFWAFFYWLTDLKILAPFFRFTRGLLNYCNFRRFAAFVRKANPEVIVTTHFKPNLLVSDLKRKKRINSFLISVVTDYAVHSFWLAEYVDIFVVALQSLKEQLISRRIAADRIKVLGIPVAREFFNLRSRKEAGRITGIDSRPFSALLVTGTIGLNALGKLASLLKERMQLIVICGKNKRLLRRLRRVHTGNIFAFPMVKNMPDFFAVSDLLVTKAGGLTIAEALASRIPLVFVCKIPGQEAANITTLTYYGCAIYEKDLYRLAQRIAGLKQDQAAMNSMKQSIDRIVRPDVNTQIARLIQSHVG